MGIVSTTLSQSNNMKFLLVLAVAAYARAEAEAKPGFVYHTGSPVVYNHLPLAYHQAPLVYHHLPAGCQNNQGVAVPCAQGVLPTLPYYGLAPGCTTMALAMLLVLTDTVTMVIIWATLGTTATGWATLPTMAILTATTDTTARGPPRPSQLLRLMPRLPQRLTPGCTTAALDMPAIPTGTDITAMVWATLPMLDTTHTPPTEAAEMATEPWFHAPGNSVDVSALVLLK